MRICLFSKPDAAQTQRLASALARRGWCVHVVWHGEHRVPNATFESFQIPSAGLWNLHRFRERRQRYLCGFLRTFDVVSIQFLHCWGFDREMIGEGCLHVRPWGSDIMPPPGGPQPSAVTLGRRRELLHMAHGVTVTCDSFRREVARFAGIQADSIDVLPIGVDLATFRPPRTPPTEPVVGFLKGFGHAYGPQHFIEAMPAVIAAIPAVRFELVGDGPLKEPCNQRAIELGINERITWRPRSAHEDVPGILRNWQVSVIPSVSESFGIAALESSAMAVPIVASAVGGLRDTVRDGETGILVPPGSPAALADAVISLLKEPQRRIALGQAGREYVATHFDEQSCMDRLDAYYRALPDRAARSAAHAEASA